MKFLHTGDLHIGKTINEFSMIEDQKHILNKIREIASAEAVDAVLIAGDVYDRPIPSTEAVELLDDFLTALLKDKKKVILISGNHDSGERVAFADRILEKQGLVIAGSYDGALKKVVLEDEWGAVDFVCMPFVKPAVASVEEMLGKITLDSASRTVLLTHYFVTGENGQTPQLSDSESMVNVGGLMNVSASLFAGFDYVALGHIHKTQKIGAGEVWYAGAPLKYSFSEVNQRKSVNVVTMGKKGDISITSHALTPRRELRVIRGRLDALISREAAGALDSRDYIKAILTDEEELIDPMGTLRSVYPNVMQIVFERKENRQTEEYRPQAFMAEKTTGELFAQFYELLRGEPMDERRARFVRQVEKELEAMEGR